MPYIFNIIPNDYLRKKTIGFYNREYIKFNQPENPDFLNILKNTFGKENNLVLEEAKSTVIKILLEDLPHVIQYNHSKNIRNLICLCVPRAKSLKQYNDNQLLFMYAVREALRNIKDIFDGTDIIVRNFNTRTTHIRKPPSNFDNNGDLPYPGILKNTCTLMVDKIRGQNLILIDDVYTSNVNIDEDCIQALYDCGAKNISFYAISKTRN